MPKHTGNLSPRPKNDATSARLVVTFLAISMLILLLAPFAIGFAAYLAFERFELLAGVQRVLASGAVGLVAMLVLNIGVMLPLAQFAAVNARRLQGTLPPDEQQLVSRLAERHTQGQHTAEEQTSSEGQSTAGPAAAGQPAESQRNAARPNHTDDHDHDEG